MHGWRGRHGRLEVAPQIEMNDSPDDMESINMSDEPKGALLVSVEGAKRQTIAAACQRCRRRKQKCSGQRPCESCKRSGTDCVFFAKENETRQQAAKRKFDEYHEVYSQILGGSESQALNIVHRIRKGEQLDSILRYPQRVSVEETIPATYERRQKQNFLVNLSQSTGSLHEVVDLASSVFSPLTGISLPDQREFQQLKDSLMTIKVLSDIVADTKRDGQLVGPSRTPRPHAHIPDGSHDGPIFWVPALPWTTLIESSYAVSHIISIFLVYINPYWRFVEEDLFLRAMREGDMDSGYCSPVLVHAMLACGAQYTEIDEVFIKTGDFITRGEDLHREAIRLSNEESQTTIANVQALLILSLESGIRGKDRWGLTMVMSALTLNKSIPNDNVLLHSEQARANYARCRQCVATSAPWLFLSYHAELAQEGDAFQDILPEETPILDDVLPDTVLFWVGYPIQKKPVRFRMNLMMRQRRKLIYLLWDTCKIVSTKNQSCDREELWRNVQDVAAKLYEWHQVLPAELGYSGKMAASLFEFQ
ncbi:hypothetical protein K431DRAFT_84247 [Polychaeton citri CBS 116435]|uniref:Zn(2)-C6 fungal-type domain-containing protein n=1 Tax=Polychaeton citri CBS 116435 TaxID=1314669 RepID=A0A9P4Q5N1_9PEZI|nr:hypothetical protein K431DRAFT_84247 [Polychaeton citri CBS 116435]